jgi:two-component sensor histidine kinase
MALPTVQPGMASFRTPSGLQEGSNVPTSPHNEVADSLSLALVASSQAPILLLDGDLAIIAVSASFCRAFQIDPATVEGLEVFALGNGEWNVPQLRSLLDVTASGITGIDNYEMDLKRDNREPRRVVLKAEKLAYGDAGHARILLAISDVTDARIAEKLRDELLRQKDTLVQDKVILLQELQHRVANSLQIIASVLMMSARRVQSEETRTHLHDAHSRVMSIAALQQQLSSSGYADVKLRAYFTKLCQTLGASMIRDHRQIQIEVDIDESVVRADVSVSLGLIVTELVINALKHAFPDDRIGKILVDYRSRGPNWTLSVSDNGVGMPRKSKETKGGLGTSLIQALAKQLEASVGVADAHPGTTVSIAHLQVAAVAVDGSAAILPRAV